MRRAPPFTPLTKRPSVWLSPLGYATAANLVTTGAQHLVNVRVGVENEDMSIELWGKNIFDSKTHEMISRPFDYDSFQTVGLQLGLARKPTYGVRMNYNF